MKSPYRAILIILVVFLSGLAFAPYVAVSSKGFDWQRYAKAYEPCQVPFFWQRDSRWNDHPLRTGGACSPYCGIIGTCGCTLTSATMLFSYYGANLTPPTLSDCMGTSACFFNWWTGASCTNGKARMVDRIGFSYTRLDQELNQNGRPVILGMRRIGNPNDTHWVLVISGHGNDPANYVMHDPWFEGGAFMNLNVRVIDNYEFYRLAIYDGRPTCSSSNIKNLHAESIQITALSSTSENGTQETRFDIPEIDTAAPSSVISGTAWVYRLTETTMTVKLEAASNMGVVTEMQVWTDANPSPSWQPFTDFVVLPWEPEHDTVYARFRDELYNISEVSSDTTHPVYSPPPEILKTFLPVILNTIH